MDVNDVQMCVSGEHATAPEREEGVVQWLINMDHWVRLDQLVGR